MQRCVRLFPTSRLRLLGKLLRRRSCPLLELKQGRSAMILHIVLQYTLRHCLCLVAVTSAMLCTVPILMHHIISYEQAEDQQDFRRQRKCYNSSRFYASEEGMVHACFHACSFRTCLDGRSCESSRCFLCELSLLRYVHEVFFSIWQGP